ncbi:MAG: hypothetical protein M1824_005213 [Vezdaea acicularis]|nr:MAG: hypothetical protein M1824_005213 [Vezdaea acicularis]
MCNECHPGVAQLAAAVTKGVDFSQVSHSTATRLTYTDDEDTIIFKSTNKSIITMKDGQLSAVESLAISKGKIVAAGAYSDAQSAAGPDAKEIDIGTKSILPGFVEPHLHLMLTSLARYYFLNLSPMVVTTLAEAKKILADDAKTKDPASGAWVVGYGYDPSRVLAHPDHSDEVNHPDLTRSMLDEISKDLPIYVLNQSGHIGYVNSKALELAGVSDSTTDPNFQKVGGKLTGVIFEQATSIIGTKIPTAKPEEYFDWCVKTLDFWASKGCTTVFDAGIGSVAGDTDILNAIQTMPVRFIGALAIQLVQNIPVGLIKSPPFLFGQVQVQAIKYWADGSTQGFTAAINDLYKDRYEDQPCGTLNHKEDQDLQKLMEPWLTRGWQLVVHSNGDRATDQVLRIYDALFTKYKGSNEKIMHRIEHFTVTSPEQVKKAAELKLGVSHTMGHVCYWGETFYDYVLGPPRASRIHAIQDDIHEDIVYSFHSDSPVTDVDCLLWVKTAMTRETFPNKHVYDKDQCVQSLAEALRGITINAAKHLGLDDKIGSLEVGKSADFVVLADDLQKVDVYNIANVRIEQTWFEGKRTWDGPTSKI